MAAASPSSLLPLVALCACSCAPEAASLWQPVAAPSSPECSGRAIDPMVVEALPVQPPGSHPLVGSLRMENGASFQWDNVAFMDDMKEKAAALGGNTIVYTDDDPRRARVYYIPEDRGSHGGDEE